MTPPDVLKPGDIIVLPRSAVDPCSLYKIVEVDPDGAVGYDPYFGEGQSWDEIPNGDVIWNLQDRGMRLATDRDRARGTADPSGAR